MSQIDDAVFLDAALRPGQDLYSHFLDCLIEIPAGFLEEMAAFQFPPSIQEQIAKLMDKNTEDQLSKDEHKELRALVDLSESVSIMKGRAKLLLHQTR